MTTEVHPSNDELKERLNYQENLLIQKRENNKKYSQKYYDSHRELVNAKRRERYRKSVENHKYKCRSKYSPNPIGRSIVDV